MKLYISNNHSTDVVKHRKNSLDFVKICIYDFLYIGKTTNYVDSKDIFEFYRGEYGKPFVRIIKDMGECPIFFSLSHSDELIICGVSHENIGVDCQKINKNIEQCRKIANRFYHKEEVAFLNDSCNEKNYIDNFFSIWTQKEAYVKFTGKGLAEGLNTFSVFDNFLRTRFQMINHDNDYKIAVFNLTENSHLESISIC